MAANRGISPEVVNLILFGMGERQRFTQETPILPDVWADYAASPTIRHDLLISPLESCSSIRVMREIKKDLAAELDRDALAQVGLAPLQTFVAARLTFHELIGIVLPRTRWTALARERFEKVDHELPFDPASAFDQVYAAARGVPRTREGNLRGQLFEIARILTLIAAIYVSQAPDVPEIM